MGKESIKLVANNKKAYHDYFIEEKYEAGKNRRGSPRVLFLTQEKRPWP